ncbi:MAG: hypothetical protein NT047_00730 [Deltaproteobacteria bacterium]|nr:hypothetical protein [Deltaproteobacteria bacterium]
MAKGVQRERAYASQDEIAFLKTLGAGMAPMARVALLKRYRATLAMRKRWGKVDPEIIEAYLNLEIGGKP